MPATAHSIVELPPELQRRVDAELASGERVVWLGQPVPELYRRGAWMLVLLGGPLTAGMLFWYSGATGLIGDRPLPLDTVFAWVFLLFALPFLVFGLLLLAAPYLFMRDARRTIYAITNRRAIVWEPKRWDKIEVRSFTPRQLIRLMRSERKDGSGDLIFEKIRESYDNASGATTVTCGFKSIQDVRGVENVLRETLLQKRGGIAV